MKEFTPAPNYKSLLIQAKVLFRLYKLKESEARFWNNRYQETNDKVIAQLKSELNSEKEMNHLLTKELEENELQ